MIDKYNHNRVWIYGFETVPQVLYEDQRAVELWILNVKNPRIVLEQGELGPFRVEMVRWDDGIPGPKNILEATDDGYIN